MVQISSIESQISADKIAGIASDVLDKGRENAERAEEEHAKPIKIFGVIEVDPALVAYLQAGYNVLADLLEKAGSGYFYTAGSWIAARLGIKNEATVKQLAAATTFGAGVVIKAGGYVSPMFDTFKTYHDDQAMLARKLAPVLDDMKGSHSVKALQSVTAAENEMIAAHRHHMLKQMHLKRSANLTDLIISAGPSIAFSAADYSGMHKKGFSPEQLKAFRDAQGAQKNSIRQYAETLVQALTPGLAAQFKKSNEKTMKRALQPYSALEMILTLQDQIAQNPAADSFDAPGKHKSWPLERYVREILIQHQRDMADISGEHTELRTALNEDLEAIAKPIAESLKKGDLAALTLVRWVGEGQLIKERGRRLATVAEVDQLLGTAEKAPMPQLTIDPKEYYVDAAFTHRDLTAALQSLQGEERTLFAALFPDTVLTHAGLKDVEIRQIRDSVTKNYESVLAATLAAVAEKTDEQLEQEGMAKAEIKQLREVMDGVKEKGAEAVHEARVSPANANGIERVLTNWAVPHVKAGRVHLGTLLAKGKERLTQLNERKETTPAAKAEPSETHAEAVEKTTADMAAEPAR